MSEDFYDTLGVDKSASEQEIRTAYRKLAHKYHPDKTGGDKVAEEKFKGINAAYDILKNKEKRAKYDQFGPEGSPFGGGGGFGGAGSPFEDIFDAFFSGGGGAGRQQRSGPSPTQGADLEYRLHITLLETSQGVTKSIHFTRAENCNECTGSGAAKGSQPQTCSQCGGAGQVRMSQGFFSVTRTCPQCQGGGTVISDPCRNCRGSGQVDTERELTVDIPAGVSTGVRLRVTGEGEAGRFNGPRGDLYVMIEVTPHDIFVREGNDLVCDLPISFPLAILGGNIKVPTLDGEAELKIPHGTQSGTVFKLRGMGLPDIRGYRKGDQLVQIQVETPTKLNKEQKELIKKFDEISTPKTYPLHKRFMDSIKASFHQK
ncbi:MAG: molecular chaperone DnaJ [Candidatus Hydrogenedentota bacterium]|nr:MAG: molecular chaperone DnaJ [Candidatus Hydrogenedentota bacterium]